MDNLTPLLIKKIDLFSQEFPQYSAGEIIYSILINLNTKNDFSKKTLLNTSDEELYTALEQAITNERD